MKTKNIFSAIIFLLLAVSGNVNAQDSRLLDQLYDDIMSSCVNMDYSYSTEVSGIKMSGNHSLEIQNDLWHMKGNGIEVWCDGESVWTSDPVAKEVIIEPAFEDSDGSLTNPALILVKLNDWFEVKDERVSSDGRSVLYIMVPKIGTNIEYLNLRVRKSDRAILSGSFAMEDGNAVNIDVVAMNMAPKRPVSYFRPAVSFDASWIVTDLR